MDISLVSCRLSRRSTKCAPLGPMYLCAALEGAGYDVELLDLQTVKGVHLFSVDALAETIRSSTGAIVAISLFADALPLVVAALQQLGRSGNERVVVLGGPGVNGNEIKLLNYLPVVQYVVRGEGEQALVQIVDAIHRKKTNLNAPGVYTRQRSGDPVGVPPQRIADLDRLPWPDYTRLSDDSYGHVSVVSSRGCPFNCSFCEIIAMWGRSTSYRDISDVIQEISHHTNSTGCHELGFIDDTFTLSKKRVLELCRGIKQAALDVHWSCFSRVDTIDEEMMDAMASAGCRTVFFGIDTGSEIIWRKINKRLSRLQVLETLSKSLERFSVTASYIWGYPDESYTEFCQTIRLASEVSRLSNRTGQVATQLHFLGPTRATPIFEHHREALRWSEDVPLEICGGRTLESFSHLDGYATCMELARSDLELFTPYYHYDSPDLGRKLAVIQNGEGLAGSTVGLTRDPSVALEILRTTQYRGDEELSAMIAAAMVGPLANDPKLLDQLRRVPVMAASSDGSRTFTVAANLRAGRGTLKAIETL